MYHLSRMTVFSESEMQVITVLRENRRDFQTWKESELVALLGRDAKRVHCAIRAHYYDGVRAKVTERRAAEIRKRAERIRRVVRQDAAASARFRAACGIVAPEPEKPRVPVLEQRPSPAVAEEAPSAARVPFEASARCEDAPFVERGELPTSGSVSEGEVSESRASGACSPDTVCYDFSPAAASPVEAGPVQSSDEPAEAAVVQPDGSAPAAAPEVHDQECCDITMVEPIDVGEVPCDELLVREVLDGIEFM
jgi:hypothetical protein